MKFWWQLLVTIQHSLEAVIDLSNLSCPSAASCSSHLSRAITAPGVTRPALTHTRVSKDFLYTGPR